MLVKVSDIPPEGMRQELCEKIEAPGIALESPVCGQLSWRRLGRRVHVTGALRGAVAASCSRCLAAFSQALDVEFSLEFLPAEDLPATDERELDRGELDVGYYSADVIDTREIIREQVLLGVPMRAVCREDCKGICPKCGADLNEGPCGCGAETGDSRFSALAKLKERM